MPTGLLTFTQAVVREYGIVMFKCAIFYIISNRLLIDHAKQLEYVLLVLNNNYLQIVLIDLKKRYQKNKNVLRIFVKSLDSKIINTIPIQSRYILTIFPVRETPNQFFELYYNFARVAAKLMSKTCLVQETRCQKIHRLRCYQVHYYVD